MRVVDEAALYHLSMRDLKSTAASRALTVVLSESDWQALRAVEPDAVGWLHERIRERLGAPERQEPKASTPRASAARASSGWGDDLY